MESLGYILASFNACLNVTTGVLLVLGFRAIRRKRMASHRYLMLSAVSVSILFLMSYVTRFLLTGVHRFPGEGMVKSAYLLILVSHTILAALLPFLVGVSLYFAWKDRRTAHKRIARVTLPIWLYVSVTGVVIYWMLYHF